MTTSRRRPVVRRKPTAKLGAEPASPSAGAPDVVGSATLSATGEPPAVELPAAVGVEARVEVPSPADTLTTAALPMLLAPPTPPAPLATPAVDPTDLAVPAGDPLAQIEVLQRQLAAVREQLTETQRLATIGTIAAVIAHEFNNLLTPIVSYTQYALGSADGPAPDMPLIRKALGKAYHSSTKAGKICASMLALARGESAGLGPVSIQRLVDEVLSVLARDPQKDGIALRVQVQPDLCAVGDAVQLEQVLLNLLINARHALMGHGRNGAITIKATAGAGDDTVGDGRTAGGGGGAGALKLQVIDNGPGIPEKVLPRIFEPFFTTKATARKGEQKGTGLGLAICREIMAHHHGRIEVESTVGKGTTFTMWLPAARLPAEREREQAVAAVA